MNDLVEIFIVSFGIASTILIIISISSYLIGH
jgi:hypothetical protein